MKQKIVPKILQEVDGPLMSCKIVFLNGTEVIEIHCYLIGKLFEYLNLSFLLLNTAIVYYEK